MNNKEIYTWLFENGGPVIHYRTATELYPSSSLLDIKSLTDELMQSPHVQAWLERLERAFFLTHPPATKRANTMALNEVHGSKPTALENIMGKLTDFGLKNGIPELDRRTLPYRKFLEGHRPSDYTFHVFMKTLIAAFLARAGYVRESAVGDVLKNRLNTVYNFVKDGNYDIYVNPDRYRNIPVNFRNRPLVNPELTRNGDSSLPSIYDIIGWAAYLPELGTEEDWIKADTIINYIFNEKYQKLPWGYGIMTNDFGNYYAIGWSVHLPGFTDSPGMNPSDSLLVLLLDLLLNFRAARRHRWFKESLNHLERFRTERGTYLFSSSYLQEKPQGYWVNGVHMKLEEGIRNKRTLELESTFRMAKFKKMITG